MSPSPTPLLPIEGSLFGYEDEGSVWLCCRMTDGSVRSLSGVTGSPLDGSYEFAFSPDPLPNDVTSPDEIDFQFLDGDQPSLPTINWNTVVSNFSVEGGFASYSIDIYADGVRLNLPDDLQNGSRSPYVLGGG